MKINLSVSLEMEDGSWNLIGVEKDIELDFIPSIGDEIYDNGLSFKVENRRVNLSDGYVDISLEPYFEITTDDDKKKVLRRMNTSGWYYKDPETYNLLEL